MLYTFVKTHGTYNTKSESERKLWTLDDNNVSILAHRLYLKSTKLMQDINNRGNGVGGGAKWLNRNSLCHLSVNLKLLIRQSVLIFLSLADCLAIRSISKSIEEAPGKMAEQAALGTPVPPGQLLHRQNVPDVTILEVCRLQTVEGLQLQHSAGPRVGKKDPILQKLGICSE